MNDEAFIRDIAKVKQASNVLFCLIYIQHYAQKDTRMLVNVYNCV